MSTPVAFIEKWSLSGASEASNAQSFTNDLCDLIGVRKPDPTLPDEHENTYVFEKSVPSTRGVKKVDCYKRSHFILENKQGAEGAAAGAALSLKKQAEQKARKTGHGKRGSKTWDTAMEKAKKQAENYARLLPSEEIVGGRPPFILVADVGHSIAVYADWSRAGGHYQPFPDPNNYRIKLADLDREDIRERLRLIWTDPLSLDPSRRSAKVTKEIADRLARLAKSLDGGSAETRAKRSGSSTEGDIAGFLMRCLFTMFAEDVGLLEDRAFTQLLEDCQRKPVSFVPKITELWNKMNTGGYSIVLDAQIRRFNGGLFSDTTAVALNEDQIQLLLEAAEADWKEVEPAIFGTLLERALNPRERHKLGAHYTPRAYVERLVQPTILEPLRKEWDGVKAAALNLTNDDKNDQAIAEVERYLQRLADLRVLDPACGSANFLYVTLELLKRLEGEVRNVLRELGQGQISIGLTGATITPENMLGIELNPRAAKIAELVLWIGYLQWHLRSTGDLSDIGDPVLRDYHNIENRDAVLEWDRVEDVLDDDGQPLTRWDGDTYKTHPVTGEQVPDDAARTQVQRIVGGRATTWPKADFIVGNPPFLGKGEKMRMALGDGYIESLRKVYKGVPGSADFVMYWWYKAAGILSLNQIERFGFITTNSISQIFNRRVISPFLEGKKPVSIIYAISDHPWVDSSDGAVVRIGMTACQAGEHGGELQTVMEENTIDDKGFVNVVLKTKKGKIFQDLSIGADVAGTVGLQSNTDIHSFGMMIRGQGFIIDREKLTSLGYDPALLPPTIKRYLKGKDITQNTKERYIIDLYGLEPPEIQSEYPAIYQHVVDNVKPERDVSRDKGFRTKWWLFGRTRPQLRKVVEPIDRYIATPETVKHRVFTFLESKIIPDHMIIAIGLDDAYFLGVLSSGIHAIWVDSTAGSLGGFIGNIRYNKTRCFDPFPFPDTNEAQKAVIRNLAERLDAHRKRQQALHPKLTMTGMYNVLEKERSGELLNEKERKIHNDGLVGILRELHDELDAAVAQAYGWPADLPEAEILQRLVDLNAERAAEEARGLVRWLRPEYQAPNEVAAAVQSKMDLGDVPTVVITEKRKWPATLPERATALRELLSVADGDLSLASVATAFKPKLAKKKLAEAESLLDTLVALGQAERGSGGWQEV
jgi:hypothetical protein